MDTLHRFNCASMAPPKLAQQDNAEVGHKEKFLVPYTLHSFKVTLEVNPSEGIRT